MSGVKPGTRLAVPGLKGIWSVWSRISEFPGAYALTPYDSPAVQNGAKYAVCKIVFPRNTATPTVTLVRVES